MESKEFNTFDNRDAWSLTEAEYAEQFWERIKQLNADHDWFLTADSIEYAELEVACMNLAPAEDIATLIWQGSLNEKGKPVTEKKEILDAVSYVKNELNEMIARSGRVEKAQQSWNDLSRQVSLFVNGYFKTDHLHIEMMEVLKDGYRYFEDLTTEFSNRNLKPNEAYVYAGFEREFLCSNGLAKQAMPTERHFCKMEFDMEKLAIYDPTGVQRYRKLHEEKETPKEKKEEQSGIVDRDYGTDQSRASIIKHKR